MNPVDLKKIYVSFLRQHIELSKPLSVVFDCSNGATGVLIREVFENIPNLTAYIINETVDGNFPAHGPNPILPEGIKDVVPAVAQNSADLGIVFDGDGDRAVFIDKKGRRIPSYAIAMFLFQNNPPPYVTDEYIYETLRYVTATEDTARDTVAYGLSADFMKSVIVSRIGTYNIKKHIKISHASVGAEQSGHYYSKDFFGHDSGLFTACRVISLLTSTDTSLEAFYDALPAFYLENKDVETHTPWSEIEKVLSKTELNEETLKGFGVKAIERRDGITYELERGWLNVRASNTQPMIRIAGGTTVSKERTAELIQILFEKIEKIL